MLNSPIDTSERDAAIDRKWHELETTGMAIFSSDEENRYISRDEIMHDVICDLSSFGLHYDIAITPMSFAIKVAELFDMALNAAMEEAINDYYIK